MLAILLSAATTAFAPSPYAAAPMFGKFASPSGANRVTEAPSMSAAFLALDAIEPAVSSYVNIWVPLFEGAKASGLAPDFLLHWGHGAAMSTVLFAMGGYGSFLGWQTRLGNGDAEFPLTLGDTAREIHPKLVSTFYHTLR